jgi:hypothetical protein
VDLAAGVELAVRSRPRAIGVPFAAEQRAHQPSRELPNGSCTLASLRTAAAVSELRDLRIRERDAP